MSFRIVLKRTLLFCAGLAICILAASPRGLVVFVLFAMGAFYLKRALWARNRRSGNSRFTFFPTYTSAGNALQQLQMLAQPRAEYVIQQKAVDDAEEDDDGELEDEADVMFQLQQIRKGKRPAKPLVIRTRSPFI